MGSLSFHTRLDTPVDHNHILDRALIYQTRKEKCFVGSSDGLFFF